MAEKKERKPRYEGQQRFYDDIPIVVKKRELTPAERRKKAGIK